MEEHFVNNVVSLYKENKWKDILKLNINSKKDFANKLMWVWPSIENLKFIENKIHENSLKGLTSIGCGCGLFEWIFQQSSKLDVIGIEINQEWWNSKYSSPLFLKLHYANLTSYVNMLNPNFALMFCYFNNGPAFIEYTKFYRGKLIFIIGPGKGRGTHTNPEPFNPDFGNSQWILNDYQEIKSTKDFIAVYVRDNNLSYIPKDEVFTISKMHLK